MFPEPSQEELQEDPEPHVVMHKGAAALERLPRVLLQEAGETGGLMPDLPLLILQKVNARVYQPGERDEKATAFPRASLACPKATPRAILPP